MFDNIDLAFSKSVMFVHSSERLNQRRGFLRPLDFFVYARHGRELMG
jgi:hypothetical protein